MPNQIQICYKKELNEVQKESVILCENIKKLREGEKLSKKDMAKRLGIGVNSLTMIENGIVPNKLTCKIIFNIQDEFNLHPKRYIKPL